MCRLRYCHHMYEACTSALFLTVLASVPFWYRWVNSKVSTSQPTTETKQLTKKLTSVPPKSDARGSYHQHMCGRVSLSEKLLNGGLNIFLRIIIKKKRENGKALKKNKKHFPSWLLLKATASLILFLISSVCISAGCQQAHLLLYKVIALIKQMSRN